MENIGVCFNYYDERGRRLALYCRYTDATTAEIFKLACSPTDQFSKAIAHDVYKTYCNDVTEFKGTVTLADGSVFHPEIIVIKDANKPEQLSLQFLLNYADKNFYRRFDIEVPTTVIKKIYVKKIQDLYNAEV